MIVHLYDDVSHLHTYPDLETAMREEVIAPMTDDDVPFLTILFTYTVMPDGTVELIMRHP